MAGQRGSGARLNCAAGWHTCRKAGAARRPLWQTVPRSAAHLRQQLRGDVMRGQAGMPHIHALQAGGGGGKASQTVSAHHWAMATCPGPSSQGLPRQPVLSRRLHCPAGGPSLQQGPPQLLPAPNKLRPSTHSQPASEKQRCPPTHRQPRAGEGEVEAEAASQAGQEVRASDVGVQPDGALGHREDGAEKGRGGWECVLGGGGMWGAKRPVPHLPPVPLNAALCPPTATTNHTGAPLCRTTVLQPCRSGQPENGPCWRRLTAR